MSNNFLTAMIQELTFPSFHKLPLDVALAWHTLILNSRWYREDCKRSHPGLTWKADDDSFVPKSFPLRAIVRLAPSRCDATRTQGESELMFLEQVGRLSLEGKLSEGREGAWRRQTHTPFDPLQALELIKDRIVTCPRCAATGISVRTHSFSFFVNPGELVNLAVDCCM